MARARGSSATIDTLDRDVAGLVAHKDEWLHLPVRRKRALLDAVRQRTLRVMDRWVALTLEAKQIEPGSHWAGPEWGIGPHFALLGLRAVHDTLVALERGAPPPVPRLTTRPDGRVVAHVFPATTLDRVLASGITLEVWMQPGVTTATLPETMATLYRQPPPTGRVALVLGAGNAVSLALLDVLHKLYVEGQVVVLKMNPVAGYMEPVFAEVLAPWIDEGYVRMVSGGAEQGEYLAMHPDVDEIHLTGGLATHDAIVFGSGEEGAARKTARQPRIDKRVTSELGGVSPVIVVPGPWTRADVRTQAEKIVGMKLNNSGHNCMSPQVLVLPEGWPPGNELLAEIERQMRMAPPQHAYYPGALQRQQALVERHPDAIQIADANVPRTLVWGLDPHAEDEPAFTQEAFGPVLAQTSLPAASPGAYLRDAVAFANDRLLGTLAATLLVHPSTPHLGTALDRAVEDLDYGSVGVNEWHMYAGVLPQGAWGGAPGAPLHDIQSGRGFVHNSFMFDRPARSVVRNSFHLAPQAWRHGRPQLTAHPLYSAIRPFGPVTGRRLAQLVGDPRWRHVPGLFAALLRGR